MTKTRNLPVMDSRFAQEASRIARTVSYAYARRSHKVDVTDAIQQSWAICMEVYRSREWTAETFDQYRNYCFAAVNRQLSRYLPRSQSVVSCAHKDEKSLRDLTVVSDAPLRTHVAPSLDLETETEIEDIRRKLKARLISLVKLTPATHAAVLVWFDGYAPNEAARIAHLPVKEVYCSNAQFARIAQNDAIFQDLANQLREARGYAQKAV